MPNAYRSFQKNNRAEHPRWFEDEDDNYRTDTAAVLRRMEKSLNSINDRVKSLDVEREETKTRFHVQEDEDSRDPSAVINRIDKGLKSINDRLKIIEAEGVRAGKRWWAK